MATQSNLVSVFPEAPPLLGELPALILPFCQKHPISKMEVFGSVAQGRAEAGSDVDLMVTFLPEVDIPSRQFLAMHQELEHLLHCRVDFMERRHVEQHENEIRRRHMLRGAKLIYGHP